MPSMLQQVFYGEKHIGIVMSIEDYITKHWAGSRSASAGNQMYKLDWDSADTIKLSGPLAVHERLGTQDPALRITIVQSTLASNVC
jgi:hypothetical protein